MARRILGSGIPSPALFTGCINALLIGLCSGITSVVLDLDHFLVPIWSNLRAGRPPFDPYDLVVNMQGRPLHCPMVVVSGVIFCYFGTRVAGLLYSLLVKNDLS